VSNTRAAGKLRVFLQEAFIVDFGTVGSIIAYVGSPGRAVPWTEVLTPPEATQAFATSI
jgi:hypothetical protein